MKAALQRHTDLCNKAECGEEIGPTGSFLGVVDVVGVKVIDENTFAWMLRNPRSFAHPIPGKGQLRLFLPPPDILNSQQFVI